jgi:dipeptidyl aminopeptidase/acylaminoacyl peptidase
MPTFLHGKFLTFLFPLFVSSFAIHGTNDRNVPYPTAKKFEEEMSAAGNPIEFHPIPNATHFIWIEPAYAAEVSDTRTRFLQKWKY